MKVEIWRDIMCPFCYIGKRKLEAALAQFALKEEVEVEWKCFQQNPTIETDGTKTIHRFLSERKGITLDKAKQMNDRLTDIAKQVGLNFNFDKPVAANSFNADRFSHLAKQYGRQDNAEELLFASYFTNGKNTADHNKLTQLDTEIGIDADEVKGMLNTKAFTDNVDSDIYEAQQLDISVVPFFIFNRKYAVSGAKESDTFLAGLNKVYSNY